MPPKLELSGRRFGKLLVENEHGRDLHGAVMWLCVCDCGSSSVVRGTWPIERALRIANEAPHG